jgi:hypothetical protein
VEEDIRAIRGADEAKTPRRNQFLDRTLLHHTYSLIVETQNVFFAARRLSS